MVTEVTDKQRVLIAQLATAGAGLTRDELATRLGKRKLNPSEVNHLEGLVLQGYAAKQTSIRGIKATSVYVLTDAGKAQFKG